MDHSAQYLRMYSTYFFRIEKEVGRWAQLEEERWADARNKYTFGVTVYITLDLPVQRSENKTFATRV